MQTILTALQNLGLDVSDPVTQHDLVYGMPGVKGASENSEPWLRVRTETKIDATLHYLTLKKSVTNQMDSIEHETLVDDPDAMTEIIRQLGFVPYSDLTKTRRKAYAGDIEICIDHINGLGDFIEAEKLTDDDADYQAVIDELWKVLISVGVSKSDEVTDGYDVLMNKKLGIE